MNRSTFRRVQILCGILLLCGISRAQIVNIERQRIASDTVGWFGSAAVAFSGQKNTKSIIALSSNTLLEYKSKSTKDLWLLITEFSLISADGDRFANNGFGHLRYNTKFNDAIRWEFFAQVQYNSLTKIDRRYLAGSGPRIKLTQFEHAKFYFGIAYMYEIEKLLDPAITLYDHRMSSYFSFSLLPEEDVSFVSTTYAQPLFTDFSDYRISNETTLILAITRKLNLTSSFRYAYDAVPPIGVPNSTYAFSNGLELEF
jgi:hypothetical protein